MAMKESRFCRLTTHFFSGFLENDLVVSSGGGLYNLYSQAAALIAAAPMFYSVLVSFKYGAMRPDVREMLAWEDRVLFVHWTMVLIGFLSVLEWDALFPDRRDFQILGPLPVPMRLIFLARLSSVLALLACFWAAANLGPALLFPPMSLAKAEVIRGLGRHTAAHLAATLAGGAFVFLSFASVQAVLMSLLPPRWFRRACVYVQFLAMLGLVLSFVLIPVLMEFAIPWIKAHNGWLYAVPSFWFLGVYEVLIGNGGPVFDPLARTALYALAASAAVASCAYVISYRRHTSRTLESMDAGSPAPGLLARAVTHALNAAVLRHPLERACFYFIAATLPRSGVHRLLLSAYSGVGIALAVVLVAVLRNDAAAGNPTPGLLAIQPLLLFFALAGLRFAFAIPAELPANCLFRAVEPADNSRCQAGVRTAMLAFGALPVVAVLVPLHWGLWGWAPAAMHLVFGAALAALFIEILLTGFNKIPFTCSYRPGKANIKALWPVYLGALWAYAYAAAMLEYTLFAHPVRLGLFCAAAVAATAALRRFGAARLREGSGFLFEDMGDPAVRTLDIAYGVKEVG